MKVKNIQYAERTILVTVESSYTSDNLSAALDLPESEPEVFNVVLKDDGNGKYNISRLDVDNVFIYNNNLWSIDERNQEQEEAKQIPGVLSIVARPLVRNLDNISLEMLARELEPNSKEFEELKALEKLSKNKQLLSKVYRAMNNYVRSTLDNCAPADS